MTKDVIVSISGLQMPAEGEAEPVEVITVGDYYQKNGKHYVLYEEVNERIIPHHKAVLEADLEEERRMFYVAMTRAKDRLHVCFARQRYGKIQEPSRFLAEYRNVETGKTDKGNKQNTIN